MKGERTIKEITPNGVMVMMTRREERDRKRKCGTKIVDATGEYMPPAGAMKRGKISL